MGNETSVKQKMNELIEKIKYHDELYYNKNYQEISDAEYDKLRKNLLELEKNYPADILKESPNKKVGKIDDQNFKTINHDSPMLSLNNAYNNSEVKSFYNKILDSNPSKMVANISKAKKYNWKPTIFLKDGINEYVEWYKKKIKN